MKILYLGNNWVGLQLLRWLREGGEDVAGLVLHPEPKRRHGPEMLEAAGLPADRIFDGARLREPDTLAAIEALRPDVAISVLFDYIFLPPFLRLFPAGVINVHPSLLPYNRGQYPNVWSIIDRTPSGTTIHYIDEGIDTGDIIAQREVPVEPVDTGERLYRKLERASVDLFKETWPAIRAGRAPRRTQAPGEGTYHRTRDVEAVDAIDLDATYRARDLIDLLRARTFPPYRGAYFEENGRRVYLQLKLEYGEE